MNNEQAVRLELGEAMMEFVQAVTEIQLQNKDAVLREVATEKYRCAIMSAAERGFEHSLCWHTLGVWTEEGKERIGCFSRALACVRAEKAKSMPDQPVAEWAHLHTETSCLYEIGRVHAHEGATEAARRFLEEALPLARRVDAVRDPKTINDDFLEGKIGALLLQLPDVDDVK